LLPQLAEPELAGPGEIWIVEHWIRLHWFELSALVLLALNLWFVIKVISVLRAVQDSLILLARWLDIARTEIDRQPEPGNDGSKR
jgi:hypothetical protein